MQEILTVNELFSGIGAQRKALERLGIAHEVVGVCEIDKYAIQSYEAIFGMTYNYGDICTAERLEYADLWTYSFPCQDISVAGNQKGISSETRSGLLYQVQRLLEVAKDEGKLPKYLLLENVKNLVGKKFKSQFDDWLFYLDQLGYDTYWQVLNAKHYGIPQNRERVFAISIRKDLNKTFEFPKPEELKIRLKDILEDEVDEKFYISQDKVQKFVKSFENLETPCIAASRGRNPENPSDRTVGAPTEQRLEINTQGTSNTITTVQKDNYVVERKIIDVSFARLEGKAREYDEIAPTLTARDYKEPRLVTEAKIQQVEGNLYPNSGNPQAGRVYKPEGISPSLDTCQGGNRMPKVVEVGHYTYPNSDKKHQSNTVYSSDGLCPTLDTMQGGNRQPKILEDIRIRKLTPLECWRLMGFDDEDFRKAESSGVSNTQLYKQAGNSIVVNVLEKIFENLYK